MGVREKLEVIAHLGDHISYKEDIGICYDSTLAKVIEDAYMTLKNGVTVQEWISVKDRLPEEGKWVLMADKYGIGVDMAKVFDDCVRTRDGDVGGIDVFTHWMPLPQPPKGE